jgi:hypothetical protein
LKSQMAKLLEEKPEMSRKRDFERRKKGSKF